jgi:murein DD-endopeptidase MepM/ murein hydrolase activator NlpD
MSSMLSALLSRHAHGLHPVIPFDASRQRLAVMDLSPGNGRFVPEVFRDIRRFTAAVEDFLSDAGCDFAFGGYGELRDMYAVSEVFDADAKGEPRRLHLGVDIWGPVGTPVHAPLPGHVHSQGFRPETGDYGGVVILSHHWQGQTFHTLYGHLSEADLVFREGDSVAAGARIGHFGGPRENGGWPPHLHLQLVFDMDGMRGDYPGVCRYSERERYMANCPDPSPLLAALLA